jgi:hypothetical protein
MKKFTSHSKHEQYLVKTQGEKWSINITPYILNECYHFEKNVCDLLAAT